MLGGMEGKGRREREGLSLSAYLQTIIKTIFDSTIFITLRLWQYIKKLRVDGST